MAVWHSGSSPDLYIVCCKKWSGVAICRSLRSGRRTCCRIIRVLEQSQRSISWRGTRLLSSLEKGNSSFLRKEFRKDCRRFLEDLVSTILSTVAARSLVGQRLSSFVPNISLEVSVILLSTSLGNCWMGCLNLVGLGGPKLNLQTLNFTLSSATSDRWKLVAIVLVCQLTLSLHSAISLVSVLGGICTKLVLWCLKSSRSAHDLTHVLLSDFSVDGVSGDGSLGVASRFYCVVESGCNWP